MMKKLNRFRHLMYKIKIQDELVCKLGTDKKPVYVEPIHKLTDLSDEKAKLEESEDHIRDIKVAAAKDRKEFLKRARGEVAEEMAEARREAEKSHSRNSIGAMQGKKATDKKVGDKKTGNKKVKNDTKPVRRNSI